jgi:ribosomal protein S6
MSEENKTTDEIKLYELGFHIVSSLSEDEAEAKFVDLKKNIGGEIVKEGELKNIPLAYTITKKIKGANVRFDKAYFGWVKFNSTPEGVEELKKKVEGDEDVLRFLLVKTVDDDEHSTSKIALEKKEEEEEKEEDTEKKEEIKEEKEGDTREMDEAIDEMVKEEE